ncbi:MAG: glycine dehydrogenase subunit 2 [Planctomycetota bacterium]|nr:MAG: glycine dehydrogenase subunit 2 [Planctomycetota bacterium]
MLIFQKSQPGRVGLRVPPLDVPEQELPELKPLRRQQKAPLPEVSQLEVVRHFSRLSQKNFSIDTHFYPLGSCTMKYNPRINERIANLDAFRHLHPHQPPEQLQGILQVLYETKQLLKKITGMDEICLHPVAGAHGELTALLLLRALFEHKGEERPFVLVPDSAHGTNPASCAIAGFRTKKIRTGADGLVDMEDFCAQLDEKVAALMLTNPNTLGLFEKNIAKISQMLHQKGAYLYMDGANLNAIVGITRPGDFGVDLLHMNLHKTFSTPHGGGGPGAGPVGVKEEFRPFLPYPDVEKQGERYGFSPPPPHTIGKVRAFYGNVGVVLRAFCYLRSHSWKDIGNIARMAVLNANYLLALLKNAYPLGYDQKTCMHEFVLDGSSLKKETGVRTLDVAKRLLDFGFHPPTIYFPLIVPEALMIEPTETESRQTLEAFAQALCQIVQEARENPQLCANAPHHMPRKRLNELQAARNPQVIFEEKSNEKRNQALL